MRVIARGWGRDHGEKEIIVTSLADVPAEAKIDSYRMGETYLENVGTRNEGTRKDYCLPFGGVRLSAGAKLNLCGTYLVHVELSRSEIARLFELTHGDQHAELSPMQVARLFYQTYGDQELGDIVRLFASFKNEGEQGAAAPGAPKVKPSKTELKLVGRSSSTPEPELTLAQKRALRKMAANR